MEFSSVDFSPAYDHAAGALLGRLEPAIVASAQLFTERFYADVSRASPVAEVLARLEPNEFVALKAHQTDYLLMISSPNLTMAAHQISALRAGRIHALAGVDIAWLVESLTFYQQGVAELAKETMPLSEARESVLRVFGLRVLFDLREQAIGFKSVSRDVSIVQSTIDSLIASTANLSDLIHGVLGALGTLPGDVSGFFARADRDGRLQIEASVGVADRYHHAMETGLIPRISIDASIPEGQGPTGRSWRSGTVIVSDAWTLEPDRAPWRSVGRELGFRSGAAVPLLDEAGHTTATITLYSSYPGYFSTNRVNKLLTHLRDVLSHAAAQRLTAPVIPLAERLHYRHLLEHHRITVHYQPIIDLRSGSLDRLEALARLQRHDGTIVAPNEFLHALGDTELFTLFTRVVHQACTDWHFLAEAGVRTRIAVNIPAQALGDVRYLDTLFANLEEHDVPPERFILEVLETQGDGPDIARHQGFIDELRRNGIEIEQDDLGSGHSSLVRMDRYPFDAVKIDQELVRGALRNPQRALEFILYLTRLAHALQTPVTVEGLENLAIIEAAAVLGADRGQGFGISPPLPARDVPKWHRHYKYPVDVRKPRTALGAMAAYVAEFAEAATIAQHFVAANALQGSDLDDLMQRSRNVTRDGAHSGSYREMRTRIIGELHAHWIEER